MDVADVVDLIMWMVQGGGDTGFALEDFPWFLLFKRLSNSSLSLRPMRSLFLSFRDKPSHVSRSGWLGSGQPYGSSVSRSKKG